MYPYTCHTCKRPYKTSDWDLSVKPYLVCYLCKEEGWVEVAGGDNPPHKEEEEKE